MSALEWTLAVAIMVLSLVLMAWQFSLFRIFEPRLLMGFYWVHVVAHLMPSMIFLADESKWARYQYFWACVLTTILIPVGGLLARLIVPLRERTITAYFRAPVEAPPDVVRTSRWLVLVLGVVGVAMLATYMRAAPHYALKEMLLSQLAIEDIKALRQQASVGDLGYMYSLARGFFMPFLFVAAVALWRYERYLLMKVVYFAIFIVVFVYNSYSGAKTPVVVVFVLAFGVFYQRRIIRPEGALSRAAASLRRRATVVTLLVTLTVAIAYPVFIFQFRPLGQTHTLTEVLIQGVLQRVVLRPAINSYNTYEIFPAARDYTYFADISKLAAVLGLERVNLSHLMAAYKEGQPVAIVVKGALAVNAPPTTIGTFYAQAGWPGLVIGMVVASMLMQVMQGLFVALHLKTPLHQAMYAVLMYGAALRLNLSEFHSVLLSEAVIPVVVMLGLYGLVRRLRILPVAARRPATATG